MDGRATVRPSRGGGGWYVDGDYVSEDAYERGVQYSDTLRAEELRDIEAISDWIINEHMTGSGQQRRTSINDLRRVWARHIRDNELPGCTRVTADGNPIRWAVQSGDGWAALSDEAVDQRIRVWLEANEVKGIATANRRDVRERIEAMSPDLDRTLWDRPDRYLCFADGRAGLDLTDPGLPVVEVPWSAYQTLRSPVTADAYQAAEKCWDESFWWNTVLAGWFPDEADRWSFLKLLACGLTGNPAGRVAYLHGPGQNGKSTLVYALGVALGPYITSLPVEHAIRGKHQPHPTGLRRLDRTRWVTIGEIPAAATWNEALLRDMTGGDQIDVRAMRQDHYQIQPALLPIAYGNELPKLVTAGPSMKARMVIVPFNARYMPGAKGRISRAEMRPRLHAEAGHILASLVTAHALAAGSDYVPKGRLAEATNRYLDEEDWLGRVVDGLTEPKPGGRVTLADLRRAAIAADIITDQVTPYRFAKVVQSAARWPMEKYRNRVWCLTDRAARDVQDLHDLPKPL